MQEMLALMFVARKIEHFDCLVVVLTSFLIELVMLVDMRRSFC